MEDYSIRPHKSVNLLIKVVIRESHLNTNAMTSQIRVQLSTLDYFMATCGHETSKFNINFKVLLDSLKVRGENKNDTLNNLFKRYTVCSYKVFARYVARK